MNISAFTAANIFVDPARKCKCAASEGRRPWRYRPPSCSTVHLYFLLPLPIVLDLRASYLTEANVSLACLGSMPDTKRSFTVQRFCSFCQRSWLRKEVLCTDCARGRSPCVPWSDKTPPISPRSAHSRLSSALASPGPD